MYDSFEYIIESAQQQQQQQQVDSLPQRQRHHSGRKLEGANFFLFLCRVGHSEVHFGTKNRSLISGRTSESRAAEGRRPVERQAPEPVPAKSCCRFYRVLPSFYQILPGFTRCRAPLKGCPKGFPLI